MPTREKEDTSQPKTIQNVRLQIVNAVLVLGSLIGIVVLLVSTYTIGIDGLLFEYLGFSFLLFCVIITTFLRHRLSFRFKSLTLLASAYLVGFISLIGWGLIGSSSIWFITTVLLTMIFHNNRSGLFAYALVVATLAIAGLAVRMDWLQFSLDFEAYATSDASWFSRIVVTVLIAAMIVASVGRVITMLRQQLEESHQRRYELAVRSQELTIEMEKREDAELALANVVDHLKDLDRLKDAFIDSVSHELRTPIANIQLYHQLLAMKPEKKDEYLKTLKVETERLHYIVEQMIYASGEDAGLELSTMIEIDLLQVTTALFKRFQDTISAKNLSLNLPESEDEFVIQAAPEHIERAIVALVDNAVKYTPRAGEIHLSMLSDETAQPQLIGIRIKNTGDCPSKREQETWFDRFVRGESSLISGVPGAGLGLSISRQIVEKYGGRVDLDCDESDNMLIFTLWVPSRLQIHDPAADTAIPVS